MSTLIERSGWCGDRGLQDRVRQALAEAGRTETAATVITGLVKSLDGDGKVFPFEDVDIEAHISDLGA